MSYCLSLLTTLEMVWPRYGLTADMPDHWGSQRLLRQLVGLGGSWMYRRWSSDVLWLVSRHIFKTTKEQKIHIEAAPQKKNKSLSKPNGIIPSDKIGLFTKLRRTASAALLHVGNLVTCDLNLRFQTSEDLPCPKIWKYLAIFENKKSRGIFSSLFLPHFTPQVVIIWFTHIFYYNSLKWQEDNPGPRS